MATSGKASDPYSGRTAYYAELSIARSTVSGTSAKWNWALRAKNPNGSSATYALDCYSWKVTVEGQSWSGCHSLDFRSGTTSITIASGTTNYVNQGTGTPTINFSFSHGPAGVFGTAADSGSFTASALASVPGAPGTPTASNIGTTTLDLSWAAAASNGSSIVNYGWQVASDTSYSHIYASGDAGTSRSAHAVGLKPAGRFYAHVAARNGVGRGPWSGNRTITMDPEPPDALKAGSATINSIPFTWDKADNGSQLAGAQFQIDSDPNFGSPVTVNLGTVTSYTKTALAPGTEYRARVRWKNSVGVYSGWRTITASTLPTTAPSIRVEPDLDGTSSVVYLTPPSGGGTPSKYTVQYRLSPDGAATSYDQTTSSMRRSGLTPGETYDWRASAWYGTYQSPWSGWVTVTQPNPTIDAGAYFDGDTPDSNNISYDWTGTPGASTSVATAPGLGLVGWMTFDDGAIVSGGTGVVTQAADPYDQSYAAQVTFFTAPDSPGFEFGQQQNAPSWSDVDEGGTYTGSIRVKIPAGVEGQTLTPRLSFFDELGQVTGVVDGTPVLVEPGGWVALTVTADAPLTTQHATITVTDQDQTRPWAAGETIAADAAMIVIGSTEVPYFNGATPDTDQWDYGWDGDANASTSYRQEVAQNATDPLADPDCPAPPAPPAAPTIDDDCITEVGQWRRFWQIVPEQEVAIWVDQVPTIIITTAETEARQVRIRWYPDEDADGVATDWVSEQVISYIPPNTTITIDGVAQRVWATTSTGQTIPADKLLYGEGGGPASWPVLDCGYQWLASFDVPLDIGAVGLTVDIGLTGKIL